MQIFYGKGANTGVRKGTVFIYENRNRHVEREVVLDTEGELSRFRMACVQTKETLENLYLKTKDSIGHEAAAIFEEMTDNLALAAKILKVMEPDERGKILGVMDAEVAAKLTKIMNPES